MAPRTTSGAGTGAFPELIDEVMEQFVPAPGGLEAPDLLPAAPAAVSAQFTGLGGTDSVTLIATAHREPLNSPEVAKAAADPSSDLGTFSTTATGSAQASRAQVSSQRVLLISACDGRATTVMLGGVTATACGSGQGPIVTFRLGAWQIQVQDLNGNSSPLSTARAVAAWAVGHSLPPASAGLASVTVPGSAAAGSEDTCQLVWASGADDYQVSGRNDNYLGTLQLAADMQPWPGR